MMILCPNCHDMATRGGLHEKEQRRFKARPHNVRKGYAEGFLRLDGPAPAVEVGGAVFVNDGTILAFDGAPIVSLGRNEAGGLLVSLVLKDQEGNVLAVVEQNVWIVGDASTWELEVGYRRMKIRQSRRKVALEVDGRQSPIRLRGNLWDGARRIFLGPTTLGLGGNHRFVAFQNLTFCSSYISLDVIEPGEDGTRIAFHQAPDPRGGGTTFVGMTKDVIERAMAELSDLRSVRATRQSNAS